MSVIATALKHMMAGGMDREAIIAAVAEMEAELAAATANDREPSRGALRQRLYRERVEASRAVIGDANVTESDDGDGGTLALDKEKSPTPPKEINPNPEGGKRATRIREDWTPEKPLPINVAALVAQWPPGRMQRELEGFVAFWLARNRDAARRDWDLVWHNRIRDQHDRIMREARNERGSRLLPQAKAATGANVLEKLRTRQAETGYG